MVNAMRSVIILQTGNPQHRSTHQGEGKSAAVLLDPVVCRSDFDVARSRRVTPDQARHVVARDLVLARPDIGVTWHAVDLFGEISTEICKGAANHHRAIGFKRNSA